MRTRPTGLGQPDNDQDGQHRRDAEDQHRTSKVSNGSSRVARLPLPFPAAALPEVVTVTAPDLGEVDGRGAVFVLPVVSEADSPRARKGGIVRRRLVALTGPAQWRLRARVEAARMQRLAWASARSRSASWRGVASG